MKLVAFTVTLIVLSSTGAFGQDGAIRIYADLNRTACTALLVPQAPLTLYVYAEASGASAGGITGAEYSISTSADTDWQWIEDFSPATSAGAITVGVGAIAGLQPGINIAWGACQSPAAAIHLQTITVLDLSGSFSGIANLLQVEAHSTPGNPFFRCPLFNLCDAPAYTKVCLGDNIETAVCPFPPGALACLYSSSGQFLLNPVGGPCDCGALDSCLPTAIDARTWGEVKGLYRSTSGADR